VRKVELTKDERIKKEVRRIKKVLGGLDRNKLEVVTPLIENAAFMAVSLRELEGIINEKGYVEEYNNGGGQSGTKQSDEVKTHIAMSRNFQAAIKILADIAPAEKRKDGKLAALRNS
jgi:hypothetical protein